MKAKSITILAIVISLLLTFSFFWGNQDNVVPLEEYALEQNEEADDEDKWASVNEEENLTELEDDVPLENNQNQETSNEKIVNEENNEQKDHVEQSDTINKPNNDSNKPESPAKHEVVTQQPQEVDIEKVKEEGKKLKEKIIAEDSNKGNKDKYLTDPVPEGKPKPVEPQNVAIDEEKVYTATLSVTAKTILNNMHLFNKDKLEVLPEDGVIYSTRTITFYKGESVFDVLQREMRNNGIHMESVWTPIYNSAYVAGINNLYEFDCGELSGWMYKVNGWFPNYGASRYQLQNNDVIEWVYTCDLGRDIGGFYSVGGG